MPTFQDHNRRTPAANADVLGDDADLAVTDEADAASPATARPLPPAAPAGREGGAAEPGRDINQAGWIHTPDEPGR